MTSAEGKTKQALATMIRRQFGISESQALLYAEDLYQEVLSRGGNPHDLDEMAKIIPVVVARWISQKQ